MSTSAEQITDLIQAGNAWQGQANNLLEDRRDHQQAYAALANDLEGVVRAQMTFSGTVDANDPAPTGLDGGTFNTIKKLVDASPRGAYVQLSLVAGQVHDIDAPIIVCNRSLFFIREGTGAAPIIRPIAYLAASNENYLNGFSILGTGSIMAQDVRIELTAAKPDVAYPWAPGRRALIVPHRSGLAHLGLKNCTVWGTEQACLVNGNGAHTAIVGLADVTLTGSVFAVGSASIALVNQSSLTLLNGAALTDGGTVGVNVLSN